MDSRQFLRRTVLAPGDRLVAVDHERGVRLALLDVSLLQFAVGLRTLSPFWAIGVKVDAPAATENAVVATGQTFEQVPSVRPQWDDSECIVVQICHPLIVGPALRQRAARLAKPKASAQGMSGRWR